MIQERFCRHVRKLAHAEGWRLKVLRPVGPQGILNGDEVINVVNLSAPGRVAKTRGRDLHRERRYPDRHGSVQDEEAQRALR